MRAIALAIFLAVGVAHGAVLRAPSNLTANVASATQINLAWKDNSSNEASFRLQRSTNGTDFALLIQTNANVTSASDATAQPSTKYWYRVRAANGNRYSTWSNTVSTTTPAVPTPTPTPTPTPIPAASVNLAWTPSASAYTGQRLYSGVLSGSYGTPREVGLGNTYTVLNLEWGQQYYFAISAYNANGESVKSNEVGVIPTPTP